LYKYGPDGYGNIVIISKDARVIKGEIMAGLHNCGEPLVYVKNANYTNKGCLLLHHDFEFNRKQLDLAKSLPVLRNLRKVWGKDVALETYLPVDVKPGEEPQYAPSVIMCTEKVYVFSSYDDKGKVIVQKEVEIDGYP